MRNEEEVTLTGRCCVFQPFDRGTFDKRFDDTIAPAIRAADLEPYRVDRDDGAVIPMETLHEEIKSAKLCLADISTRNANVMYELGYAIAAGKDVIIICAESQTEQFPFDIQHRGILKYAADSVSDFKTLEAEITKKAKALLRKQQTTIDIVSASPIKSTKGLQPNEVTALALIMANVDSSEDAVSVHIVKRDMESAGYTRLATQLALTSLSRIKYICPQEVQDGYGDPYTAYKVLRAGEDWLLENQGRLEMRLCEESPDRSVPDFGPGLSDDDVPF